MRYDEGWHRHVTGARYDRGFGSREYGPDRASPARNRVPTSYDTAQLTPVYDRLHGPARYGLGPYHERLRRRRRPDEDLRKDVSEALFFDTWVDSDAIEVEVVDGVVTLRGDLPSYEEIRFAADDAWDVEGVLGVRTELRVTGY